VRWRILSETLSRRQSDYVKIDESSPLYKVYQRVKYCPKIEEQSQNYGRQNRNVKQGPFWVSTVTGRQNRNVKQGPFWGSTVTGRHRKTLFATTAWMWTGEKFIILLFYYWHHQNGAVGWGTALQTGRSRVRFLMVSLKFFIDIILKPHYGPGVDSASNINEYQQYFLG
jgi:hypothetical protein